MKFLQIALIATALFPTLFGASVGLSQDPKLQADKREQLESAAKAFIRQLADSEFSQAAETFDETMTQALQPTQLQTIWSGITQSAGEFQQPTQFHHQSVDVYDTVIVTCQFANALLDTKIVFDQRGRIAGLFFLPPTNRAGYTMPSYVKPDTFEESEITFGEEPWKLTGTVSLPKNGDKVPGDKVPGDRVPGDRVPGDRVPGDKVPAIILVHGSGPNDRDETVAANKPFKDLAGGLASKGIAVLRYDKRTKTHGAKMSKQVTVREETIDDVIAAVKQLTMFESIDSRRIFVLGHSLGGYLVPRIAKADSEGQIAGYIIMAGNTRPLEDLIQDQTRYLLGLDGKISDADQQSLDQINQQVQQVKSIAEQTADQSVFGASVTYWTDLHGYQPHLEAKLVSKPILILQGERDYQVTMKDFAAWQSALGDRSDTTFKSYPKLNHLMIAGDGPSKPAEYQVAGHVAGEVIDDLAGWIMRH